MIEEELSCREKEGCDVMQKRKGRRIAANAYTIKQSRSVGGYFSLSSLVRHFVAVPLVGGALKHPKISTYS